MQSDSTAIVLMGENEAREAIKAMRLAMENSLSSFDHAMRIAERFKEQEGWKALGYRSLGACLSFELQVSRSRAYQLIDQLKASALLAEETGERQEKPVSSKKAREILRPSSEESVYPVDSSEPADRAEPVVRERVGGGNVHIDYGFDEGEAVYRCRHCQRIGTIEQLAHCLEVVREQGEEF